MARRKFGNVRPDMGQRQNYQTTTLPNHSNFQNINVGGPQWGAMNHLLNMLYGSEALPFQPGYNSQIQKMFGAANDPNRTMM